jgi:Cu(I)-responsive transcriptional regulator
MTRTWRAPQLEGDGLMNIGEVANRSGLPAKTIRYYEDIGLVLPSARKANGYRDYDEQDLNLLKFVQRARSLGFTVEQCRELLDLYRDRGRASADVKAIAKGRIADIRRKIAELKSMEATLAALVEHCHGDGLPDCPILDDLAGVPGDRRH